MGTRWSTGLFECHKDIESCAVGTWYPGFLFAINMQELVGSDPRDCCLIPWDSCQFTVSVWDEQKITMRTAVKYFCLYAGPQTIILVIDILALIVDVPIVVNHLNQGGTWEELTLSIILHCVLASLTVLSMLWSFAYGAYYRTRMRRKYNIQSSIFWDWHDHCCWDWCAVCQEARHIRDFNRARATPSELNAAPVGKVTPVDAPVQ